MAYHCALGTSVFPSLPFLNLPRTRRTLKQSFRFYGAIRCQLESSEAENETKRKRNQLDILKLSVTLTVISASLPLPSLARAKAPEKKRSSKKADGLTPEEVKTWSQELPVVSQRIPYSEIFSLRREGKLKRIIKRPTADLKYRPELVLAVLEDSSVLRIVLPSKWIDTKFWDSWNELGLDSICVNAYTPSVKKPELPPPSLVGWLMRMGSGISDSEQPKPQSKGLSYPEQPKPQSKKALEIMRMRVELLSTDTNASARMRLESEMMEKAIREQKRKEERERRMEMRRWKNEDRMSYLASLRRREALPSNDSSAESNLWSELATDSNFTTALGCFFFVLFYQTVVLSYRKQKKDYDERLKIQAAEAEEKRKMRALDIEMGIEGGEEGSGEQNDYMKTAMQFMRSGARVRRARGKRPPQFMDSVVDVKFSDVAGLGDIRLELEEIVKFFTHGEIYRRRGVKIPGGILLCGPPGVGKTLLAKAVAGEAGVNFFSISASQFVEIYVGVGASRVRTLYQEARENAPSVVFIDELDAVGRKRGLIKGSGGQERDATLNQLLVSLDGFEGRGEVITIASTNRPDILDPALVRPGRFDRKIHIPVPGLIGRVEILKVHARKKPMAEDVDYVAVANVTRGMVGAELANILEVAAINMMRDGRTEITTDDLLQAAHIEEKGYLEKKEWSPEMWKRIAMDKAAVAVVAVNFPDSRSIESITIAPRGGSDLGYVRIKMDDLKFKGGFLSRQSLLDHITVQLASRAADEIWYGEGQLSTIWATTANNARLAARRFVIGGLSQTNYGVSSSWNADRIDNIDVEALKILNMCYARAKEILLKNREFMDALTNELAEKKSLDKKEFNRLVELYGSLEPMPPSLIDIRAAKRLQFQDMMMRMETAVESNV